ncbi:MAG: DUF2796 domain-containing protein [Rhizobiaceae bacterium]
MKTRIILAAVVGLAMTGLSGAEEKHDHDHDEPKALEAHEHGKSQLNIAIDGTKVELELESPGNDIVGFEHAAESDAQKKLVSDALAILEKPMALFTPPAAAGCSLTEAEAEHELEGEHAGFHTHWSMECSNIKSLTSFSVTFFDKFSAAEEIEVQAISEGGQIGIELHDDDKSINLSDIVG